MKYTNQQLRDIVESEGMGYAITDYLDPNNIEDTYIRGLWLAASHAMSLLHEKLFDDPVSYEDESIDGNAREDEDDGDIANFADS